MSFCPKCGNQLNDNAKFCPKCGTKGNNVEKPTNQESDANLSDNVINRSTVGQSSVGSIKIDMSDKVNNCEFCRTPISGTNRSIKCLECGE